MRNEESLPFSHSSFLIPHPSFRQEEIIRRRSPAACEPRHRSRVRLVTEVSHQSLVVRSGKVNGTGVGSPLTSSNLTTND
jgi:hypothetical protein